MHLNNIVGRATAALCFAVALFVAPIFPTAAVAKEKAIIILDFSGSMAARILGERKIDIARQAMRDLLKTWNPNIELGLMAYGHRRKGDCKDIEMLYPVGRVDPRQMMSAVGRLRPLGKTPLGAAVLQAAKRLHYTEDKATVVLLSDGKETCGVDPWKLGLALKKDGVDFKAYVIGFDVKRGEERGLVCLAKNTGGRSSRRATQRHWLAPWSARYARSRDPPSRNQNPPRLSLALNSSPSTRKAASNSKAISGGRSSARS